jgi:hypothetical protein
MIEKKRAETAAKKAKVAAGRAARERKRHDTAINAKGIAVSALRRLEGDADYSKLKVAELKAILTVLNADTRGSKQVLVERCGEMGMSIEEAAGDEVAADESQQAEDDDESEASESDEGEQSEGDAE